MTDYLVREGEVDFARPLPRALLRDSRLSWGARGLFAFLWDLPGGWRPNSRHLAVMGPDGRDAVRARLAELVAVGALRFEPIPAAEGGRFCGKKWVLRAAELWAREAPLAADKTAETAPDGQVTEGRISRLSDSPTVGKPTSKVHQREDSPSNENHHHLAVGGYLGGGNENPEWREAAALEVEFAAASPRGVRNPAALTKKILARYGEQGGPDAEVLAELARRRDAAQRLAAQEASRLPVAPPASPEAATRGLARAKAALQRGATT